MLFQADDWILGFLNLKNEYLLIYFSIAFLEAISVAEVVVVHVFPSQFYVEWRRKVMDARGSFSFKDIKDAGLKLTDYVCPTTLL